jgi:DNA adenine methylase
MTNSNVPRPFLKWVGGKTQLLDELVSSYDKARVTGSYHEPFLGGGALYFELSRTERLDGTAYLSDINGNLIGTYQSIRNSLQDVIKLLKKHARSHSEEYYYKVRAEVPRKKASRAARTIYLNKTCFNGLYRENKKGMFNVPMGRYTNPKILDEDNLRAVSAALRHADIEIRPFSTILDRVSSGDFVYFDPPYQPLSRTSSFTSYDRNGFDEEKQLELAGVFHQLSLAGAKVLLSNSNSPLIRKAYKAFNIRKVYANRMVNSKAEKRGKIPELLISNF